MKRTTKLLTGIAAAFILAGIAVICVAMAKNDRLLSFFVGPNYETRTVSVDDVFRNISILGDTQDVSFLPSSDGKCVVVFYESGKEKHTAAVENDTLTIAANDTREWYEHITFFSSGTPKITVYLPRAVYASLLIKTSAGDIALPKSFTFDRIEISGDTGDVDCRASASGRLRIDTDTGDIRCEGLAAGELSLSVSTGRAEVRSASCSGDMEVNVSTGETFLTDVSCKSFSSDGSTGDITMSAVISAQTIMIERSTGDVILKDCDAAELLIETDTGDVTGSLLTEKIFFAQSDTGRIKVPETTTGGKCKITTDTGDIAFTVSDRRK